MHKGQLLAEFASLFPDAPSPACCRAPGRINLIGEHTDYNGSPVLPMTIDRDITLAYAPRNEATIHAANANAAFPSAEFTNAAHIRPSQEGHWINYCKAAVQGLNQHFNTTEFPGMDFLVQATLPNAAGLSSSSALVVACALAYLDVLGLSLGQDISRLELAEVLAASERYAGTQSGGMDQAIILLGGDSCALKIDFFPLRCEEAPLPPGYRIVACNSLVKAEKSGDARHRYNEGPLTCQLIRAIIEKRLKEDLGKDLELERLGHLWTGGLCMTHKEVAGLFEATFTRETMTLAEVAHELDMNVDTLRARWFHDFKEPAGGLRLKTMARHQRTEYERVESARDALLDGNAEEFGQLMIQSHESCAKDYGVSCPELDKLVEVALEAGATGARLTGAGFGGCTVNLVPEEALEEFQRKVQQHYYGDFLGAADHSGAILPVKPSPCAGAF